MNVLVVTRSAWDDANSIGNTMSNLWHGFSSDNIANLYFRDNLPNNKVCRKYFSISEKQIISFKKPGKSFDIHDKKSAQAVNNILENRTYNHFRSNPSNSALLIRELIWKTGRWKNHKLQDFLHNFDPDIIFSPCFGVLYAHDVLYYCKRNTNAKLVLFHADNYLILDKKCSSFVERFRRILISKEVAKSALMADLNYCISQKQLDEYSKDLNLNNMKLLYKGAKFNKKPAYKKATTDKTVRIVYIGALIYGRWKTLSMLADIIQNINEKGSEFVLDIYSQYEPTATQLKTFVIDGVSNFKGKIEASEVPSVLRNSDIVLHVESFDESEKLATRLSFSTKIVDLLNSGRTVMAVGWEEAASIEYLKKNDAALVASNREEIVGHFEKIAENRSILDEYSNKSWECGKKNHQIQKVQNDLYDDLKNLVRADR